MLLFVSLVFLLILSVGVVILIIAILMVHLDNNLVSMDFSNVT